MKKYKKKPTKLLQIRLSDKEHEEVTEFINGFGVTHREWIMTVINELKDKKLIKDNQFWQDWKSYSYFNNDKWDKTITEESVCEICGKRDKNAQWGHGLQRHHHQGYEGDNANKVHIVCTKHHGMAHIAKRESISWEQFLENPEIVESYRKTPKY